MRSVTKIILSLILVLGFTYAPAAIAADPNPKDNFTLSEFIKSGVKVFYLGNQLGYNGWFMIKDGQVQIAYAPPDNKSIMIGVLFDAQGNDISAQQLKTLYDNNSEVHTIMSNLAGQTGQTQQQTLPQIGQFGQNPQGTMQSSPGIVPSATSPSALTPASPGERLIKALQDAAGVNVGAQTAPKLYMVADPNCPHCQATWKILRPALLAGKLQIRIVPIDAIDADSARAAAQFLSSANPIDAWDKYVMGDHNQLAGTPGPSALAAIRANHELIESWHISGTPYMTYRGKDGQVKIIEGEPQQGAAMIDDIAP